MAVNAPIEDLRRKRAKELGATLSGGADDLIAGIRAIDTEQKAQTDRMLKMARDKAEEERKAAAEGRATTQLGLNQNADARAANAEKRAADTFTQQQAILAAEQARKAKLFEDQQKKTRQDEAARQTSVALAGGLSRGDLEKRAADVGMSPDELLAAADALEQQRLLDEETAQQKRDKIAADKARADAATKNAAANSSRAWAAFEESKRHNKAMEGNAAAQAAATAGAKQAALDDKRKQQVLEVEGFRTNINDNIDMLINQINDTGTFEATGPEGADMERRITAIATDMAKLADPGSVAREGEVALAKKGLFPTGIKSAFMRDATAIQTLQNLKKEVSKRADNAYRIRGLTPPAMGDGDGVDPENSIDNAVDATSEWDDLEDANG